MAYRKDTYSSKLVLIDVVSGPQNVVAKGDRGLGGETILYRGEVRELYRGVAQLVARAVWDREVVGSSPIAPTN